MRRAQPETTDAETTGRRRERSPSTCSCAREYARRWPDMGPAELAGVHEPLCPVRLAHLDRERRRAAAGPSHRSAGP